MTIQSVLQLDFDHFGWLEYSAGTRQIANFVRQRQAQPGHDVSISTSASLYTCLDFYRSIYSMRRWRLTVRSVSTQASDYVVIDVFDAPRGIPAGYRRVWRDPLSGAVIAVPVNAAEGR